MMKTTAEKNENLHPQGRGNLMRISILRKLFWNSWEWGKSGACERQCGN